MLSVSLNAVGDILIKTTFCCFVVDFVGILWVLVDFMMWRMYITVAGDWKMYLTLAGD